MILEGKVAILSYGLCFLWIGLIANWGGTTNAIAYYCFLILSHVTILYLYVQKYFEVFWRAYFLGCSFLLGLFIAFYQAEVWMALGVYICVVSFFHISEYLSTAFLNPSTLKIESFLINHSTAYNIAHVLCIVEYFLWSWLLPGIKTWWWIQAVGLATCVIGEIARKTAMYVAGTNFTHVIQYEKKKEHMLVTTGIYAYCRHPSYAGWYFWSIGTQILVCNPVCFIGYSIVSWKFFDERIYHEEILLLNFFQKDYLDYQARVPTGVPFVTGYKLSENERNLFSSHEY